MKKILIVLIICFFCGNVYAFKQINIKTYLKYKEKVWKIEKQLDEKDINKKIKKIKCNYYKNWDYFYILPSCFIKNELPELSLKETSDLIFPFIKKFDNVYKLKEQYFTYKPTKTSFFKKYDLWKIIKNSDLNQKFLLYILAKKNYYIKIPKIYIAFKKFKNYSLYVSSKNLSKRKKNKLNNFNVAIKQIDWYLFKSWEILNFNDLIAYKDWYIKWKEEKYMFYAGVCWTSTMLFRNALINPYLYVLERYSHAKRYVNFYSSYIYWDDASVYENIKKLVIKNNSSTDIYFKKKIIDNNIYFVSIIPRESSKISYVNKKQIWDLRARVLNIVFDKNWNIVYEQNWVTNYLSKNYEI